MNDVNLQFCSGQAVFGNGTTVQSDNWIDWKVAQDLAGGRAPVVEIIVTLAFAGGTSVRFQLCAVDAAGANPVVLDTTDAIAIAGLTAAAAGVPGAGGTRLQLRLSPRGALPTATLTHLRLQTVNVGNNTQGSITAQLVDDAGTVMPNKAYPSGY